ncbi:MAG: efflux RND transporter periplasmic adaptor subunit, partial [Pseudomonadota bacterium]|nr:efflux RND transporter periplasmic adaptor subunit [Pseudomonadota bacterium]
DAETSQPLLATVARGDIENTVAAAGTLKPSSFVDVGAQVSGILQKLYVDVGDTVEQGQLLAEIDARVQQSRVDASRANILAQEAQLEARKASLVLAKANADRQTRLMAEQATSQLEYDNAVNNLAAAESSLIQLEKQIEQSRASLSQEETQLGFTKIYAPTAGTVVTIEMNEGRTLNAAQVAPNILRIANLDVMRVESDISEADVGAVRPGMRVYFKTLGGGERRWYSTVQQILPTPEVLNNVVLYTGLFEVENSDGTLLSEMTAQVYFVTSSAENVLTVPLGALTFSGQEEASARFAALAANGNGGSGRNDGNAGGPPNRNPPEGGAPEAGSAPQNGNVAGGGFRRDPAAGFSARGQRPAAPRPALVTLVHPDGTQEERQVMVGLTSRVAAEIISGLKEGDQVVAGVVQPGMPEQPQQQQQNRGPNIRIGGGGFRGF